MKQNRAKKLAYISSLQIPGLLLYSIIFIYPFLQVVYLSMFRWNGMGKVPKVFIGLQNYIALLNDKAFLLSFYNSFVFIIVAFAITLPLSLGISLLINTKIIGRNLLRFTYYIPAILPTTVVGVLFVFLLSSAGDIMNPDSIATRILQMIFSKDIHIYWLNDKRLAIWSVALVNAWRSIGYFMLFFLAGLAAIPRDIIEASMIDGAGPIRRLIYVTLPNLTEMLKIYIVINIGGAFQIFDIVYVMTAGGPANATQLPVTLLYNNAFRYFGSYGYSSAIGVVLLVITMLIYFFTNRVLKSEQNG